MDLNILLKKTEARSAKIKSGRQPLTVATKDRPYFNDLENNSALASNKVTQEPTNLEEKLEVKLEPNQSQTEAKLEPNQSQRATRKTKTRAKLEPELEPQLEPNRSQTRAKLEPNLSISILVGLQRNVLGFVYNSCRFNGNKESEPINILDMANSLKSTVSATKKATQRVIEKQFMYRSNTKAGRGGWSQYGIFDTVYQQLLRTETRAKLEPNWSQTRVKLEPELEPELEPSSPSSSILSSSPDLKENTNTSEAINPTKQDKKESGPDPIWGEIDFSGLAEINFNKYHLRQWRDRKYCSPQEAQDSIWHFEYDYTHHFRSDSKKKALSILMGTMAKSKYYARPDGYKSPEEIAQQGRLEEEERRAYQQKLLLDKLFEAKFEIWFNSQTGNTIKALSHGVSTFEARKSLVRQKFQDEHWFTVKDNPDVDPMTLVIPIQEMAAAHPIESARNHAPIGLPVKQFNELDLAKERCASELEVIRQLEEGIEKEPKESLRTSFRSQIAIHKKKLEKLFTEFPELKEEKRLIDEAMESLGKGNSRPNQQ
ncbi:MAG: hypothetical protein ABIQ95_03845 [Bdellovibrionia bacterium]